MGFINTLICFAKSSSGLKNKRFLATSPSWNWKGPHTYKYRLKYYQTKDSNLNRIRIFNFTHAIKNISGEISSRRGYYCLTVLTRRTLGVEMIYYCFWETCIRHERVKSFRGLSWIASSAWGHTSMFSHSSVGFRDSSTQLMCPSSSTFLAAMCS